MAGKFKSVGSKPKKFKPQITQKTQIEDEEEEPRMTQRTRIIKKKPCSEESPLEGRKRGVFEK